MWSHQLHKLGIKKEKREGLALLTVPLRATHSLPVTFALEISLSDQSDEKPSVFLK